VLIVCVCGARYYSSTVVAPVHLTTGAASMKCRQLVVDTTSTDGLRPHAKSPALSRSMSSQNSTTPRHPTTTAPLGFSSPAARQMSCPEPSQQCSDFPTVEMVFGRWLSCVVSHVDDPENFFCQLSGSDNANKLEAMMSHIEKYVSCLPPGIGKLRSATLGQPVIAKYSDDQRWYRARVTGVYVPQA